jgi:limonene-1,2-epoxide hydrolase
MTDLSAAEAEIRHFHARYADAVFRKDIVGFGDCFTEDTYWDLGVTAAHGRSQAEALLTTALARSHFVLMTFRTPIVDINKGVITSRTYVTEQNARKNEPPEFTVATYFERFADQAGVWRRAWAFFQLHYIGPEDFSGTFLGQPDCGPPPAMPLRKA